MAVLGSAAPQPAARCNACRRLPTRGSSAVDQARFRWTRLRCSLPPGLPQTPPWDRLQHARSASTSTTTDRPRNRAVRQTRRALAGRFHCSMTVRACAAVHRSTRPSFFFRRCVSLIITSDPALPRAGLATLDVVHGGDTEQLAHPLNRVISRLCPDELECAHFRSPHEDGDRFTRTSRCFLRSAFSLRSRFSSSSIHSLRSEAEPSHLGLALFQACSCSAASAHPVQVHQLLQSVHVHALHAPVSGRTTARSS